MNCAFPLGSENGLADPLEFENGIADPLEFENVFARRMDFLAECPLETGMSDLQDKTCEWR